MRRAVALLAAVAATTAATAIATAPSFAADPQTFYVFGDGDDSATCLTPHTACQTIQAALAKATGSGDTVVVGAGSYSGDVTVTSPVTIVNLAGDSPTISGAVTIGDAGGDVTVQGLTFTGAGGITVAGNTGTTTLTGNVFVATTATAIELDGPATGPAMAVALDGNSGTVTAPDRTVAVTGAVAVTAGAPDTITWTDPVPAIDSSGTPVLVVPGGAAQALATLTVPDQTPALSNARYDIAVTSAGVLDHSQISIGDDSGNDAGLVGDTAPGDTLTGSLPYVAGPVMRTVSVATTVGAPSTFTVTLSLVEYDQHQVPLNRVAVGSVNVVGNHPPTAAATTVRMLDTDTAVSFALPGSDPDPGQTLTYSLLGQPAHGTVALDSTTGAATYTATGAAQSDSFSYVVNDGYDSSAPATVTIGVDHHPVARPVAATWRCNSGPRAVPLQGADPDGTAVTFHLASSPAHGRVRIDPTTGAASYRADTDFVGSDSFSYTVVDATGLQSPPATVHITVAKATSTITTSLAPVRLTSAQHAVLTVHVSTAGRATNGVVAVATGSDTRTAVVDRHGTAALWLPRYSGGTHQITVRFRGTPTAAAGAPRSVRFTVTKVASSLSVTTDPLQLTTKTTHATATVRVAAPLVAESGVVAIAENGRRLATGTVRGGSVRLQLPQFSLGQHNLTVSYTGTAAIAPSSVVQVERVSLGP